MHGALLCGEEGEGRVAVTSVLPSVVSFSSAGGWSPATFSALTWTVGFVRTEVRACIHSYRIPSELHSTYKGRGCAP